MNFEYILEPDHFRDYGIACSRELANVNSTRRQLMLGCVIGTVIAVLGLCAWKFTGNSTACWTFIIGAWTFWCFNYFLGLYVGGRAISFAYAKNGLVLGSRKMSANDSDLNIMGDFFRLDVNWKSIRSVSAQHLVLVLWTEPASGIFIPRSAFGNPGEEQRFISFIQSKIVTS